MEVIDKFEGDFAFLSNFYPAEIIYKGICYPTVEHAYQAAKSDDPSVRRLMAHHSNPALAKKAGKVIRLREDWEDAKLGIMKPNPVNPRQDYREFGDMFFDRIKDPLELNNGINDINNQKSIAELRSYYEDFKKQIPGIGMKEMKNTHTDDSI